MRQKKETRVRLLGEDFFKLNSTFKKLLMSCASFYCMAAKWSEEGRERDDFRMPGLWRGYLSEN